MKGDAPPLLEVARARLAMVLPERLCPVRAAWMISVPSLMNRPLLPPVRLAEKAT